MSKGALALINDLIDELEANVALATVEDLPAVPAPSSSAGAGAATKAVKAAEAKSEEGEKKKEGKESKEGEEGKDGKDGRDGAKGYKKKGGGGRPAKVEPAYPPKDVETVHALDFRVGVIRSVKKHETADKLYCEEIDIGEAEPRQIASGLVPHYSLEEMQGRRLIVVANLKPRNLVGFKSSGMVLCAAVADASHPSGEKIEFIEPPADAKPGDRVMGEGLQFYDALTQAQTEKQKMWEKVAAGLKVDAEGNATWNGTKLVAGEAGAPLTAPTVRDAAIR